jgi:hypothetical protein
VFVETNARSLTAALATRLKGAAVLFGVYPEPLTKPDAINWYLFAADKLYVKVAKAPTALVLVGRAIDKELFLQLAHQ